MSARCVIFSGMKFERPIVGELLAAIERKLPLLQVLVAGPLAQPPPDLLARKAQVMRDFHAAYAALKTHWAEQGTPSTRYDRWVAKANNASFGMQAVYHGWVPAFEADKVCGKKQLSDIIWRCYKAVGQQRTVETLDRLKEMGFRSATKAAKGMPAVSPPAMLSKASKPALRITVTVRKSISVERMRG